jgi:hypothetical protein
MAAATAVALSGLALSGYQAYQGYKNNKDGKDALANYKRQNLAESNPYKNLQISTVGSDIMRQDNQINSANAIDAMREGGSRGIAMLPMLSAQNNQANQETRAYLDNQVLKRDYAIAGDQTAIRDMQENRENADLAGIGQQIQTGRQNMWSGIRGMGNSAMYAANNIDWNGDGETQADKDYSRMGGSGMSADDFRNRFSSIYKPNPLG